MNKILKRVISGIATVSLGMNLVGAMPAIADETAVTSTTTRTLSVDFMGRGSSPQESSPGSARLTADDIGNEFWVGVAVDNVNDLPLFTDGIYSLELAFEYDPNFVTPYFTSNAAETEWAAALESGNLAAANSSTWWNSEQYEIISVAETDIDTVTDRENADVMAQREAAGWKMCTVCVTLKSGASFDGARFKDLADATKQYLLKLPFKLNSVPADDAVDPNPRVLSLVRGPETLDIGSGETGTDPYSAWEATVTDPNDATNMKTLFTFPGDISLFDAGGAIENIVPAMTETDAETGDTTETTYTLSTTKDLTLDGFKAETFDYYLSVPNETEKIKLKITSSELPSVTANSASVTTTLTSTDKLYETAEFDLAELDKTVEADGYNNTVTVTAGGTTYILHIRRLLKPKIVLNYGNSPYGEIMKADNIADADKDAAKEAFNTGNKYSSSYLPDNAIAKKNITYTTRAWVDIQNLGSMTDDEKALIADSTVNMDRNDYAIFVYNENHFRDPGFEATDSMGNKVENVTRKITVNRMSRDQLNGLKDENQAPYTITIDNQPSDYLITEVTMPYDYSDSTTRRIRPDVYYMEYCFEDSMAGTVTATRPVIILQSRGDTYCTNLINDSSANPVYTYLKSLSSFDALTGTARRVYFYKVLDIDSSNLINDSDANPIYSYLKNYLPGVQAGTPPATNPLEPLYVELPNT